jgi:hypothetical protein
MVLLLERMMAQILPSSAPFHLRKQNPTIETGFAFINVNLAWQTPDVGKAVFFSCGGITYAAFDPSSLFGDALAPYSNCSRTALGGIASALCQA